MKNSKLLWILLLLTLSACDGCEERDWTTLPPETQTGANTFGCYVNGEPFVSQRGYAPYFGQPHLYAEYGTQTSLLEVFAYGKKGGIYLRIYNPKEGVNGCFIVSCEIGKKEYEGHNCFLVKDSITNESLFVEGNQGAGIIYLTRLDTVNKIASGNFHCKMGNSEGDYKLKDINNYVLDSVANITQGRFDVVMSVYNN